MFTKLCTKLWILKDNLKNDERGISALEYVILIAVVLAAVVGFFGSDLFTGIFDNANEVLTEVGGAGGVGGE